ITWAPKSDRITAAPGPAMKLAKSTTFSPEKMLSVAIINFPHSPARELRRALLEKGRCAFLLVVGRGAQRKKRAFHDQAFGLARLQPSVDRLDGEFHRQRGVPEDLPEDLLGARDERAGGHDLVDQPDAVGLLRADHPARENELERPSPPDQPRQALRAAVAGDDAQLDFRLTERRLPRRQPAR